MDESEKPQLSSSAPYTAVANEIAFAADADIIQWSGGIERNHDHSFMQLVISREQKRSNVILILTTSGGDPHAAFRMGRCLQRHYKNIIVFVPGWCKSAGTLLALAANHLIIGDHGELGPLDVQRAKSDELREQRSGLVEESALNHLNVISIRAFDLVIGNLKGISEGSVTLRTAAEIASNFVQGVYGSIYSQINPYNIGEAARSMNIARDYGIRLAMTSKNLSS